MTVCKCIMPLRQRSTLNCRRASRPLMRLVEGEDRREAFEQSQGVLQNWGGNNSNRTVNCMVLRGKANDRRTILPFIVMNFVDLHLTQSRSGGIRNNQNRGII
ncbi:hypothetical protein TNCV_442181 [Trichonephila clavipes]|nr:hypothetical protein TNCV_442181 [Trichonephila clavipes]